MDFRELSSAASGEPSANIRERVSQARETQLKRFKNSRGTKTNAAMGARQVREHCGLDAEGQGYLEQAMEDQHFSARAHGRILKVARTIADLAGEKTSARRMCSKRFNFVRWIASCFSEKGNAEFQGPPFNRYESGDSEILNPHTPVGARMSGAVMRSVHSQNDDGETV